MSNGVAQNGAGKSSRIGRGRHSRSRKHIPAPSEQEAVVEDALSDLVPLEVFNILRAKWSAADLDKLAELIVQHLDLVTHRKQEAHEHGLA